MTKSFYPCMDWPVSARKPEVKRKYVKPSGFIKGKCARCGTSRNVAESGPLEGVCAPCRGMLRRWSERKALPLFSWPENGSALSPRKHKTGLGDCERCGKQGLWVAISGPLTGMCEKCRGNTTQWSKKTGNPPTSWRKLFPFGGKR